MNDKEIRGFLRDLNTHGQIIVPLSESTLVTAIGRRSVVRFRYRGKRVTVKPHAIGLTFSGTEALRAYPVGKSHRAELFNLKNISAVEIRAEVFSPDPDYDSQKDPVMRRVHAAVERAQGGIRR